MATKKKSTKGNSGGRTASSDPKLQVFKGFTGCNFELSPTDMTHVSPALDDVNDRQSDLQMTYVVVQDNVTTTSNQTFETRNNLRLLYESKGEFSGAASSVGNGIFASVFPNGDQAGTDVYYISAYSKKPNEAKLIKRDDKDGPFSGEWTSFGVIENELIALSTEETIDGKKKIYYMELPDNFPDNTDFENKKLTSAHHIDKPSLPLDFPEMVSEAPIEDRPFAIQVELDDEQTAGCPYRFEICYCYVGKFGPTEVSDSLVFYSDKTALEFQNSGASITWRDSVTDSDILAVEFFMNTDDSIEPLFCGRTEVQNGKWSWTYTGYVNIDSNILLANRSAPTVNYTSGPDAKYFNCVDGRVYFWDDDNRIRIGGVPGNLLNVSPGTGGGFVDIAPIEDLEVRFVDKYKTQSGNDIVTVLCDSKRSSREQRFNLVEENISLDSVNDAKSWSAEQVAGAVGCKSPYGAKVCADGLYTVSRYGLALTTLTMEYNSQIQTNYVSQAIRPIFTDKNGVDLSNAILFESDGVIYLAFGNTKTDAKDYENIIFCYDISSKAWWTYSLPLSDETILNMVHVDYEGDQEGIAIITKNKIWLLPLTQDDSPTDEFNDTSLVTIMTGELSTQMPQQAYQYLSQIEFHFDYFLGDLDFQVDAIDIFGRKVRVQKKIEYKETQYNLTEYMRIDLKLQSYKITMRGHARMRLTHWISKVYTMSNKMGLVWGFDDRMSHRNSGDIHPTFKCYNDIKKAIIP